MDTLVLGIGSGRCGTVSLASLLSMQDGFRVTHERYGHHVRWNAPWRTYPAMLWMESQDYPAPVCGDVAFYWLPQIDRFAEAAQADGVDLKVVCLRRDRAETVASYERKVGQGVDHWRYRPDAASEWSWCFPCYDASTREDAIGMYYDAYYQAAERLDADVYHMATSDLNDEGAVREMLQWVGVSDPIVKTGIRKNATR